MNRAKVSAHPGLYLAIAGLTAAVFVADAMSRIGIATWIFYLIPISLTFYLRQPAMPLLLAALCSGLLVADSFISAPGAIEIARINRVFGVVTMWVVGIQARMLILSQASMHRHNWTRSTQAALSERMRGDHEVEELGRRVLDFLAERFEARVGAMYVIEHGRLRRIAAHALDLESEQQCRGFAVGEGLPGHAAQRSKPFVIDDLPEDYLRVSSALGARRPATLMFIPALADGQVTGVIELGLFRPPLAEELELIEQLAEPIGVELQTALLSQQRRELLEETQRQAEMLQVQQEELRVANEELEQQSSALRDSQARLENQQAELEQTNAQLEEHTSLLARHNEDLARAKRELDEKAIALERANQHKSEFLANMSHELRTPLNSSLILAKLLADNRSGNLTEEQVRFARSIYSSGNDLLELINDILDLSKVETGNVQFTPEPLQPARLAESLMQALRPLAQQKCIGFTLELAEDAPASIETDSTRLRQILRNLLSNAIKFTDKGDVKLRISAAGSDSVAFAVSDTGIGIAPDQQAIIFEPFRQADGTTSRKYGGTGLGLSISRELAQLLGGRIDLQSTPGAGSIFTLVLPRQFRAPPAAAAPPSEPRSPARPQPARAPAPARSAVADDRTRITDAGRVLLVVEDDTVFAEMLYEIAHAAGFHCLIAGTADEGIELALQYRPTAIILDVGLPDHSGLTVLDRLKHNAATRHIPIQIVSAGDYAQPALQMGAAGVLTKPVNQEELLQALSRLESKRADGERSVLVVEDNAAQRESICALLSSATVRTVPVETAAAALEQLQRATFDCMVLDLSLPDASGYELLEKMAHEDVYSFPPVIVYTGRSPSAEEEQRLRRYSRSIIIKGAKSPERLLEEVTLFLHQVESSLPPDRQRMLREVRSRETALEGRRILVVEDDVRNIFALTSVLEPSGATVLIARNGREALDALAREPGIDLVLMDIMMPEMDGLEATRRIRAQPALAKLPIIALTAKAMPDDRKLCLDAGASDYITKPIDVEKLLSLIRIWLPR